MRDLVCFHLGDSELAVPIEDVRETVDLRPITPVFRMPRSVAGITSIRGEIVAVLDAGVMLGLAPCTRDHDARIVIVEAGDRQAGLLVDRLGALRDLTGSEIGPVPPTLAPSVAAMLRGVLSAAERPVGVLDVSRLLGSPELDAYTSAGRDARPPTSAGPAGTGS